MPGLSLNQSHHDWQHANVGDSPASIATGWSEPVPGRELHPLKSSAFHGALLPQQSLNFRPGIWEDLHRFIDKIAAMDSKGYVLLSFLLFLVLPSSAASPEPEVVSFRSGEITLQGMLYKPEGKDHFLRSFTTMGVLLACSANRHSKRSGPCLQATDGCSLDHTGEAKALVLRQVGTLAMR
jgi:hypothetical protein